MAAVEPPVPSPDAAGVVIQEEPRYETMGEVGPFMVMEVDESGGVLSTAYYATHDEATAFATVIAEEGNVQDDTEDVADAGEEVTETPAEEAVEESVVEEPVVEEAPVESE